MNTLHDLRALDGNSDPHPQPQSTAHISALSIDRLQPLEGWAMVQRAAGYVWQPTTVEAIRDLYALARAQGRTIAPRGVGNSYNDAALNSEDIILDLSQMRGVLAWDPQTGIITVQPGLTVRDLWRAVVADGWWPPVVPGTMGPTIGGCVAMNIHGKNAWKAGPIGDHLLALDLLLPTGELRTLTPGGEPDLWHAVVGSLGMLGVITSITLQMRRIHSGKLQTRQRAANSLRDLFTLFADEIPTADYLVGWIDGFATGTQLGRGLTRRANFIETPDAASLSPMAQDLAPRIAGVIPRSEVWRAMKMVFNDTAMRFANNGQFIAGGRDGDKAHLQTHAQYHFLHDYMPNWKRAWLPGGLRQFQVFAPAATAPALFTELLRRSQHDGLHPYLCVFKQHRADDYLLSYQRDGFSLSLDYRVTASNADHLATLFAAMRADVLAAGARFYLAKDDQLDAASYRQSMGDAAIDRFMALKHQFDPDGVLQSNLFRRVFDVRRGPGY